MTLGEKIKRIRTFRGLTQRDLGLKLDTMEKMLMYELHNTNPGIVFLKKTHSLRCLKS